MRPTITMLVDCRRLARVEAARLAKRLQRAEPDVQLVAWVPAGEDCRPWVGYERVVTDLQQMESEK